jgi:hypothetical protein
MKAPIALFAFRRPEHLSATLAALAANHGARDHDLVAFSDGPRRPADEVGVAGVRRVLDEWAGQGKFRTFTCDLQTSNLGLRRSIIRGVGRLCAEAGSVIVVEDDILTSPWFLQYCREGLSIYANDAAVASIHGYIYPVAQKLPETFFLRGADCWGWATWRRAWAHYDDDAERLMERLREANLIRTFNHGGSRNLVAMLEAARDGRVDSWAIRWHASAMLAEMHTLYPGRTLVRNIGLDSSGSHGDKQTTGLIATPTTSPVGVQRQEIREDRAAWTAIGDHFRHQMPLGIPGRLFRRLRHLITRGDER